ncbi:hypothetical protein EBO15_11760 [Actinomadura harenae]|uniref:GTPase HflX N-terminal domain-containing protein n=3 Tax=Actinomadura harenae TaxID=2483351 RepID=A0A3M2M636_9ACTN|nr:hypothetical protein EBO15_11760 [Actinomadura harenae]
MDALTSEVAALGGRVVGRFVQRRGISGGKKGRAPGGKSNMGRPYSSRTLMSTGKVSEIAEERAAVDAVAVVFFNPLTGRQRKVLTELLACPVFSRADLQPPGASAPAPAERQSRLLEPGRSQVT